MTPADNTCVVIRHEGQEDCRIPFPVEGTLDQLLAHVSGVFGLGKQPFHLTDFRQPIANVAALKPGTVLHVAMGLPGQLSCPGKETVSFQPHPKTLTMAGDYEYFAAQGRHPFVYALAEFIDNSLRAASRMPLPRHIKVSFLLSSTSPSSASGLVCIADTGCGMSKEDLNDWAVMNYSVEERGQLVLLEDEHGVAGFTKYLNSSISYFGVGSKNAAFFIGSRVKVVTKRAGEPYVHELQLSAADLEKRYRAGAAVYEETMVHRAIGDVSSVASWESRFPAVQEWVQAEMGVPLEAGFTRVLISGLKPDVLGQIIKETEGARICRELAHLYHFYLHGESGNIEGSGRRDTPDCPNIELESRLSNRTLWQRRLAEVEDDMETRLLRVQKSTFTFSFQVPDKGTVWGVLYYFPYENGSETVPVDPDLINTAVGSARNSLEVQATQQQQQTAGAQLHGLLSQLVVGSTQVSDPAIGTTTAVQSNDSDEETPPNRGRAPIFEVFWQGRLIPGAQVDSVPFLDQLRQKRTAASRDVLPDEVFTRLRGSLFLSSRFRVTRNKLLLRDDLGALLADAIPGERNILRKARDWLVSCHAALDKVVRFESPGDARLQAIVRARLGSEQLTVFERVNIGGEVVASMNASITSTATRDVVVTNEDPQGPENSNTECVTAIINTNDVVRLDTRPAHLGRVAYFTVPQAGATWGAHAGGRVHVQLLPTVVYGEDNPRAFSLRRLLWRGGPVLPEEIADHEQREMERVPARLRLEPLKFAAQGEISFCAGESIPETNITVLSGGGQKLSRTVLNGNRQALVVTQSLWRISGEQTEEQVSSKKSAGAQQKQRKGRATKRGGKHNHDTADENVDPQTAGQGQESTKDSGQTMMPQHKELVLQVENKSPVRDVFYFVRLTNGLTKTGQYILQYTVQPAPAGLETPLSVELTLNVKAGPAEEIQLGGEGAAVAALRPLALGEPLSSLTVSFLDAYGNPASIPDNIMDAPPRISLRSTSSHIDIGPDRSSPVDVVFKSLQANESLVTLHGITVVPRALQPLPGLLGATAGHKTDASPPGDSNGCLPGQTSGDRNTSESVADTLSARLEVEVLYGTGSRDGTTHPSDDIGTLLSAGLDLQLRAGAPVQVKLLPGHPWASEHPPTTQQLDDGSMHQDPSIPVQVRSGTALPAFSIETLDAWGHRTKSLPGQELAVKVSGSCLQDESKLVCLPGTDGQLASDNDDHSSGLLTITDLMMTTTNSTSDQDNYSLRLQLSFMGKNADKQATSYGALKSGLMALLKNKDMVDVTTQDKDFNHLFPAIVLPVQVLPSLLPVALGLEMGASLSSSAGSQVLVRPRRKTNPDGGDEPRVDELMLPEGLVAGSVLLGLRLVLLDGSGNLSQETVPGRATVSWRRGSKGMTWSGEGLRLPSLQAPETVPSGEHEEWVRFSGEDGRLVLQAVIKIRIVPALPCAWALRWAGQTRKHGEGSQGETQLEDIDLGTAPSSSEREAVARCGQSFYLEAEVLDKFNNRCDVVGAPEEHFPPPVLEVEGPKDEEMEVETRDWKTIGVPRQDSNNDDDQTPNQPGFFRTTVNLKGRPGQVRLTIQSPKELSLEFAEDSLVLELVPGPAQRLAFAMSGALRCGLNAVLPSLSVIATDAAGNPVPWPAGTSRGGKKKASSDMEVSLGGGALNTDGGGAAAAVTVPGGNKSRPRASSGAVVFRNVHVAADVAGMYTLRAVCASRHVALEDATLCLEAAPSNAVTGLEVAITVGRHAADDAVLIVDDESFVEYRVGSPVTPTVKVTLETEDNLGIPFSAAHRGLTLRLMPPGVSSTRDAVRLKLMAGGDKGRNNDDHTTSQAGLAVEEAEEQGARHSSLLKPTTNNKRKDFSFTLDSEVLREAGVWTIAAEYSEHRQDLLNDALEGEENDDDEENRDRHEKGANKGQRKRGHDGNPKASTATVVRSHSSRLHVLPGQATGLDVEAVSLPDALTAGNGESDSTVLQGVSLQLVDEFGNAVPEAGVSVQVAIASRPRSSSQHTLTATSPSSSSPSHLPVLVSTLGANIGSCEVQTDSRGRAELGDLLIQEGSGRGCCKGSPDGTARLALEAQAQLPPEQPVWITAWSVPLLFTDQASKASALAELNSKREKALARKEEISSIIEAARQEVESAEASLEEAKEQLEQVEQEAFPGNVSVPESLALGQQALQLALEASRKESKEQQLAKNAVVAPRKARYGPAKSPMTSSIKLLLDSADLGLVGVVAEMATIEHPDLARIASTQFRSLLDVVVVEDWEARQRLVKLLESRKGPVPDILAQSHAVPYRGPTEGSIPEFDQGASELAQMLVASACADGADPPLPVPLPHTKALAKVRSAAGLEKNLQGWPEGCLGYLFNLVRPKTPEARAGLLYGLLGPALVFENLESAARYRELVVQRLQASLSDMITLDGRRITGRGIVSGSNFHVPPLDRADWRFGSRGGPPPVPASRAARAASALRDWCSAREEVEVTTRALEEAWARLQALEEEHGSEQEALEEELDDLGTQLGGISPQSMRSGKQARLEGSSRGRRSKRRRHL